MPFMTGFSLKYAHESGFKLHKNMEMCLLPIAGGSELILLVTSVKFSTLTVANFILVLFDEFLPICYCNQFLFSVFISLVYIAFGFNCDIAVCVQTGNVQ
jgi:hypothetical protein